MKVILFGASGNLGSAIARELLVQGYSLTVAVRKEFQASLFENATVKIVDVCQQGALKDQLNGFDVVISALGKSVSPNDWSKPSFESVDYEGNINILNEALLAGVKKFVYVSAFHAERYKHLTYFNVHHRFTEKLINSGIDYTIVKPPALFSAFVDIIEMAKKGRLFHIGRGDKKTNPIFEGDLAKIIVQAMNQHYAIIEAGGKNIYTRKQLNEIIGREVRPHRKIRTVPLGLLKTTLPVLKLMNKNAYDKFAFFTEVMQHDTIAPQLGDMRFEDYVKLKVEPASPVSNAG